MGTQIEISFLGFKFGSHYFQNEKIDVLKHLSIYSWEMTKCIKGNPWTTFSIKLAAVERLALVIRYPSRYLRTSAILRFVIKRR